MRLFYSGFRDYAGSLTIYRAELWLIAGFGVLNAILYAALMPLWEGFDEPFHYGYVQTISSRAKIPELGRTVLSQEILESLRTAPMSPAVKRNVPFAATFSDFFAMTEAERRARRERLWTLGQELRWKDSGAANYEAQQAPLAYLVLSPVDLLESRAPLPARILILRLFSGIAAAVVEAWLAVALARAIGLVEIWHGSVLLLVFCAQMFYATVARVSNDWLAVPAMTAVFLAAVRFRRQPNARNGVLLGISIAVGLLAKAYFLFALPFTLLAAIAAGRKALRPLLLAAGIVAIVAGPWYLRNLWLYRNLSGVMQARGSVRWTQLGRAAVEIHWAGAAETIARTALWTGNNSFTAFSSRTVTLLMILLACGCIGWLRFPREKLLGAGCALFASALLFAQLLFYEGEVTVAPWYTIAAAAPFACLICAGLSRSARIGRCIAVALHAVLAYVIVATYWLKLIPLYAGFPDSRAHVSALAEWYRSGGWRGLRDTSLAPAELILAMVALVAVLAAGLLVLRSRELVTHWNS